MKPGLLLKSTSLLNDTFFENAVVFITEYNEKGAMGFVVNQKYSRTLNELSAFRHMEPFPLYLGGPVDQEHLFFIHQRPDIIKGGELLSGNIYLGGDFKSAVKGIDNQMLGGEGIKIFLGYCGWDYRELDGEIEEGSWEVMEQGDPFSFAREK